MQGRANRISRFFSLAVVLALAMFALSAKEKKPLLPAYVLKAESVLVLIDPDAGTAPSDPLKNRHVQEDVEKALLKWGRFRIVVTTDQADLVIVVRKGSGKIVQPTVGGLPTNDRPIIVEQTDNTVRVAGQRGSPTGSQQPPAAPSPQLEAGQPDDNFAVYPGGGNFTLERSPVWRYINKDGLKSPSVPAVAEFKKAVEEAEKQQNQQKKP